MSKQPKDELSFQDYIYKIESSLVTRERLIHKNPDYRLSAVMMLLMEIDGKPHLLLTERSQFVKTHKGEISLPGGGDHPDDESIQETAYRETFEEVGVHKDKIQYLGRFDDYLSIFGFHISTFIGVISHPFKYDFCESEIADYIEMPMSIFENLEYDRLEYYDNGESEKFPMYYYYFKSKKIWGLTARIVTEFAQKIVVKG